MVGEITGKIGPIRAWHFWLWRPLSNPCLTDLARFVRDASTPLPSSPVHSMLSSDTGISELDSDDFYGPSHRSSVETVKLVLNYMDEKGISLAQLFDSVLYGDPKCTADHACRRHRTSFFNDVSLPRVLDRIMKQSGATGPKFKLEEWMKESVMTELDEEIKRAAKHLNTGEPTRHLPKGSDQKQSQGSHSGMPHPFQIAYEILIFVSIGDYYHHKPISLHPLKSRQLCTAGILPLLQGGRPIIQSEYPSSRISPFSSRPITSMSLSGYLLRGYRIRARFRAERRLRFTPYRTWSSLMASNFGRHQGPLVTWNTKTVLPRVCPP